MRLSAQSPERFLKLSSVSVCVCVCGSRPSTYCVKPEFDDWCCVEFVKFFDPEPTSPSGPGHVGHGARTVLKGGWSSLCVPSALCVQPDSDR